MSIGSEACSWVLAELQQLKDQELERKLQDHVILPGGWLMREGRKQLNLSSNHYLGLSLELEQQVFMELREEAISLESSLRIGASASRLVVGNDPIYSLFEREFAAFKGTEGCLLFGSGYTCNVGIIPTLVGRSDVVLGDRYNHASLVDGVTLSRARHLLYRHRDMDHLEKLLKQAPPNAKKLIITDSIFSMDGSVAPLAEIVQLKQRYGAMLMVDEAHSGGVYGEEGQGLIHQLGLTQHVDIVMGTFSKAYGTLGAYAVGNHNIINYILQTARSLMYTTALPPLIIHLIKHNWGVVKREGWRRESLQSNAHYLRRKLQEMGFNTGQSECHIIPIIVGANEQTLLFGQRLREEGVAAVAIRPPTVPEGTSRIRLSVMATHTVEQLQTAAYIMKRVGTELEIIP